MFISSVIIQIIDINDEKQFSLHEATDCSARSSDEEDSNVHAEDNVSDVDLNVECCKVYGEDKDKLSYNKDEECTFEGKQGNDDFEENETIAIVNRQFQATK